MHLPFTTDELLCYLSPKQAPFIREAFFGGRSEIYMPNLKKGFNYDINSSYPFSMSQFALPVGDLVGPIKIHDSLGFGLYELPAFFGFCKARVFTYPNNKALPLLPFRYKDKTTCYPNGSFEGWYFSEELKYARTVGYIVVVSDVIYAKPKPSIFKEFIEQNYLIRTLPTTDSYKKFLIKLILNNLYGRWALQLNNIKTKLISNEDELFKLETTKSITNKIPLSNSNNEIIYLVSYREEAELDNIKADSSFTRNQFTRNKVATFYSACVTSYGGKHKLVLSVVF